MTDHPGEAQVWADNHLAMSRSAATLLHAVGDAFRVLSAIRYSAPWRRAPSAKRRAQAA